MSRFSLMIAALLTCGAASANAERIVAVGGSVTEIVYALGAGDQLVGVDTTSLFPPQTEALPKVGYMRALTAEGLLTLRPELILAVQEAGPASALSQVSQAGVRTALIGVDLLPGSIADRIRAVGAALGKAQQADAMATAFTDDLAAVTAVARRKPQRVKVLFLLSASGGSILASGRRTAADAIIEAAGGMNAIAGYDGYKPASAESVAMADPDVILMTTQTFDAIGGIDKIKKLPGVLATRAAREDRVICFESGYLLGLGPRTAHAVRDLAQALAPSTRLPALPARPWTELQ
jgi:iron complex transport system substrate-binding protein